jgi:hypothetical protein
MSFTDEKKVDASDEVSKVDTSLPPHPDAGLTEEERKKRVSVTRRTYVPG